MTPRPTVAIIGAGFSGLLTVLHLLRHPDGPNMRLVERRGAFARGAAYSTVDPEHLLNVRASNMSAFPDDPTHFVRWLAQAGYEGAQSQFVPRSQYGDYLQALIQEAVESAAAGRFLLEPDAAVAIQANDDGWRVTLAMGRVFEADAVVLALGNLPPAAPPGFAADVLMCPAYIADPWNFEADRLPHTGTAVLIGTGLSMIDVALHVARLRPHLRMLAMSRRGLLPRRHLVEGPAPVSRSAPEDQGALSLLSELRRAARTEDWRAVLDGLRPHVHSVWRGWSAKERRRFLRHARPWWDVHRHRLAPPVASKLDHLIGSGNLKVAAGRIVSARLGEADLELIWRERSATDDRFQSAAVVINCAGPNTDPERTNDPLLASLISQGLIRPCREKLGLDVDPEGRLVGGNAHVARTLFAVGPLTRGSIWEITSVPDIRMQALERALTVMQVLGSGKVE